MVLLYLLTSIEYCPLMALDRVAVMIRRRRGRKGPEGPAALLLLCLLCYYPATTDARMPRGQIVHQHVKGARPRRTYLSFYMHNIMQSPPPANTTAPRGAILQQSDNKSTAPAPPPAGAGRSLHVVDDLLTKGPSMASKVVGRAHGVYVRDPRSDYEVAMVFLTCVIRSTGPYNGSSFMLQGADSMALPYREVAVVGGTGRFRIAQGFSSIETIMQKTRTSSSMYVGHYHYTLLRFNASIIH